MRIRISSCSWRTPGEVVESSFPESRHAKGRSEYSLSFWDSVCGSNRRVFVFFHVTMFWFKFATARARFPTANIFDDCFTFFGKMAGRRTPSYPAFSNLPKPPTKCHHESSVFCPVGACKLDIWSFSNYMTNVRVCRRPPYSNIFPGCPFPATNLQPQGRAS